MKARIAASVVLAAGVVLGTSACNLLAPQATTYHYDPSDGVSATVGDLAIRNAFLVSNDGAQANLVFTVVNSASDDIDLEIQFDTVAGKKTETLTVPADTTKVVGPAGDTRLVLSDLDDVQAGSLLPVYFQHGDEEGKQALLPVLSGDMASYSTLAPSPGPSAVPAQTPAAVPAPTETPAGDH